MTLSDFTTLAGNTNYSWRVDLGLADATVITGEVWSFTTKIAREFPSWNSRPISSGASWVVNSKSGDLASDNNGTTFTKRALIYSTDTYQSDHGFRLTIAYTTGSIGDSAGHNLSFGLISTETHLPSYSGFNPFRVGTDVHSIGANLTTDGSDTGRGLNLNNGITEATGVIAEGFDLFRERGRESILRLRV